VVALTTASLVTGGAAGVLTGAVAAAVGWSTHLDAHDREAVRPPPDGGVTLVALVDLPSSEVDEASRQLRPGAVELLLVDATGRRT
jgi:hypothetical protein